MSATAYNDLEIVNISMDLIGQRPLNSIIEPTTDNEARASRIYPITLSMLLSRHDWNFARPFRQLAVNADETPYGGYDHAYRFPDDLIAGPYAVYDSGDLTRPVTDYLNINNHIHTNLDAVTVRYKNRPATENFPHYFVDLLAHACAARLAKPVADDNELATELRIRTYGGNDETLNGGLLGAAKKEDAQSEPLKTLFVNGDLLTAQVF